jgi:hypothetical protein
MPEFVIEKAGLPIRTAITAGPGKDVKTNKEQENQQVVEI